MVAITTRAANVVTIFVLVVNQPRKVLCNVLDRTPYTVALLHQSMCKWLCAHLEMRYVNINKFSLLSRMQICTCCTPVCALVNTPQEAWSNLLCTWHDLTHINSPYIPYSIF